MQVNNYVLPTKHEKISTTELKKALEKIKQTQLQVLSALKNEGQIINLNQSHIRIANENVQANVPYIKSISHLNLLKMAEVINMRKQFQRQRERYQDKIATFQQKIKLLQGQIEFKKRLEGQWNQQRTVLNNKIKELLQAKSNQGKSINSQTLIKAQVVSYKEELAEKIKDKYKMQSEISNLQGKVNDILQENELYKNKYERLLKQTLEKEKNRFEKNMKMSQHLYKSKLPLEEMMVELKKVAQNHEKVYQSLKTRARITVTDLDVEEQMQQSISRLLSLVQSSQKQLHQDKKVIQIDDSVIQGFRGYDSESFRDEVKKFDKELFEHENFRKEIYDLKAQILNLKQQKNNAEFQLLKTKEELTVRDQKLKKHQEKDKECYANEYQALILQLQNEMRKIRQQKNSLANLVKKISENAFKSNDDEFNKNLRDQLAQIIEHNENLRNENENYKLTIDGLNITLQNLRYENSKYEEHINYNKAILQKQSKDKQTQRNKFERDINEKDANYQKAQQKINELNYIIQNNTKKYEAEQNFNLNQINVLRQEVEKNMKQLRNLRKLAYDFQLLTAQNQILKQKLMQVNSTIIHLWQVKQAQYGNIYETLSDLKKV